ncbi:hypothetical protein SCG7086_AS_00100 [Chlamydiales bacterium SCGC AG-110-P3]|nr:hypothetical protein SCG7086_AS_00100 [Chlamydiales bacterium SCGC AG-110-P3]
MYHFFHNSCIDSAEIIPRMTYLRNRASDEKQTPTIHFT